MKEPFQSFLFVRKNGKGWAAKKCNEYCETTLTERGQYSVGTIFSRSAFYPLQVSPDDPPRAILLFQAPAGDLLPSVTVQIQNKKSAAFQWRSSDDIRLTKVELHHRFKENDEVLNFWEVFGERAQEDLRISFEQWKGGAHEVFIRAYDDLQSTDSGSITIFYADEETMREKRLRDLRAVIDEWVHVLADLLESNEDQEIIEGINSRIDQIEYPEIEEESLIAAYIRELISLGKRIQNWALYEIDFEGTPNLIKRTEKEILYGLSLIFQEKTGEIEATSDALRSSQDELNALLEKIQKGEVEFDSKMLEEAFKKLAKEIEDLQKKIRELPQGPSDDLINREALEAQAEDADSLAKRIEEIKKQLESGDQAGALRELESLMNQLSILTKEIERSLDQWKENLDQDAMQASQRYIKDLKDLKERQDEISKKTEEVKEMAEKLDMKDFDEVDPKELGEVQKKYEELKEQELKLAEDFNSLTDKFDSDLDGTEWKEAFRSEEAKKMESDIQERMEGAGEALRSERGHEALTNEKEASHLMQQAIEKQGQKQQQAQSRLQGKDQASGKKAREKVDIISSQGKGEKERRRKILDSLKQKVDERFQKSHEQYFEEMLQR